MKIWLLDDDKTCGMFIERQWASHGHEVRVFTDVDDFRAALKAGADLPALFVLDQHMPKANGDVIRDEIRADGAEALCASLSGAEQEMGAWDVLLSKERPTETVNQLDLISRLLSRLAAKDQTLARLREMAKALSRSNEDLDHFASAAAHQLRASPQSIGGLVEIVLKDATALSPEHREYLELCVADARLLTELVDGLYRFGQARRLSQEDFRPIDLNRVIQNLIRHKIRAKRPVIPTAESGLPTVVGSETMLYQVLNNLVTNAYTYTDAADPKVWIINGTSDEEGMVCIGVRDNGFGLDEHQIGKLFGLYSRLHPQTPGTGVGLALGKSVVERHGGKIWAESEGHGKGSTFWISLPSGI